MTVAQDERDAVKTLFTNKLRDYISEDKIYFWM